MGGGKLTQGSRPWLRYWRENLKRVSIPCRSEGKPGAVLSADGWWPSWEGISQWEIREMCSFFIVYIRQSVGRELCGNAAGWKKGLKWLSESGAKLYFCWLEKKYIVWLKLNWRRYKPRLAEVGERGKKKKKLPGCRGKKGSRIYTNYAAIGPCTLWGRVGGA